MSISWFVFFDDNRKLVQQDCVLANKPFSILRYIAFNQETDLYYFIFFC